MVEQRYGNYFKWLVQRSSMHDIGVLERLQETQRRNWQKKRNREVPGNLQVTIPKHLVIKAEGRV